MNLLYSNFQKTAKTFIKNYELDKEETAIVLNLLGYFFNEKTDLDKNKGILLRGKVGTGKTILIKIIQRMLPVNKKFLYNHVVEVSNHAQSGRPLDLYAKQERLFDDIGTEHKANYYGKPIEVIEELIYSRYDNFQSNGVLTHFTTNADNESLKQKYGSRAYDRLCEMVNVVNWTGTESKRGIGIKAEPIKEANNKPDEDKKKEIEKLYVVDLIADFKKCVDEKSYFLKQETIDYTYKFLFEKGIMNIEPSRRQQEYDKQRKFICELSNKDKSRRKEYDDFKRDDFNSKTNYFHNQAILKSRKAILKEWTMEGVEFGFDFEGELKNLIN